MPDPSLLLFIAERPDDAILWALLAQQYGDADQLDIAAWLKRDHGMIWRLLQGPIQDVLAIRNEAKKINADAVKLIDALTPLLRRKQVQLLQRVPPLPIRT